MRICAYAAEMYTVEGKGKFSFHTVIVCVCVCEWIIFLYVFDMV